MQTVSSDSTANSITVMFTSMQEAGKKISFKDNKGNVLAEYTAEKMFSSIVYADGTLKTGDTYSFCMDDEPLFEVTLSETLTIVDENGDASQTGMMGGMGGGMHAHGGWNQTPSGQDKSSDDADPNFAAPNQKSDDTDQNSAEEPGKASGSADQNSAEEPDKASDSADQGSAESVPETQNKTTDQSSGKSSAL